MTAPAGHPEAANRFAVFTAPRCVELRSEVIPEPAHGEALVRIRACALCTMEQRLWNGTARDYPIAAGHETAGVVVAVDAASAFAISAGDPVFIAFLDRCMQCEACRRGDSHLCEGKFRGRRPNLLRRIGGLADYAIVPAWKLFPMPSDRSFEEIALCEPIACVVHSIGKAALRFGDDVLVIGFGVMGYLHLLLARLRGARAFVSDPDPGRRQLALDCGAIAAFEPVDVAAGVRRWTRGSGVDAAFVTYGARDTVAQAGASVRRGGRIIYFGSFPHGMTSDVDVCRLHEHEVMIVGSRGHTLDDCQQAARLVAANLVNVLPLISARYPLHRVAEALDRAIVPSTYRVIVTP